MFERGDEVFLRGAGWGHSENTVRVVDFFVQAVRDAYFWVWFEGEGERFVDSRLAWLGLVGNPDWNNQFEGAEELPVICGGCGVSDGCVCAGVSGVQERVESERAVDPTHYDFPGGVQVIDITRHLGFLEGNIIKYVARAGRKGDRLEDLLKARRYLDWAIEGASGE